MFRGRSFDFSVPIFPLPLTATHRIDKNSPLYPYLQTDGTLSGDIEIIVVIEGTDELTANMFQSRNSYTLEEIVYNRRFKNIVSRDLETGMFEIDPSGLSTTESY